MMAEKKFPKIKIKQIASSIKKILYEIYTQHKKRLSVDFK